MPELPPKPISLSDASLLFVMQITEPLHPRDRSAFLETLAARLRNELELGDGNIHRIACEVLRGFFKAPKIDHREPMSPARLARQKQAAPILED